MTGVGSVHVRCLVQLSTQRFDDGKITIQLEAVGVRPADLAVLPAHTDRGDSDTNTQTTCTRDVFDCTNRTTQNIAITVNNCTTTFRLLEKAFWRNIDMSCCRRGTLVVFRLITALHEHMHAHLTQRIFVSGGMLCEPIFHTFGTQSELKSRPSLSLAHASPVDWLSDPMI